MNERFEMDTKCYVEGCKSGYEPCKEALYFFKPKDKNTVELWEKFIGRKDLKLDTIHLVCHKHFEDANIITVLVQQQNQTGEANDTPPLPAENTCVKLAAGAVPTLLTGKLVTEVYPPKTVLASLPPAVTVSQEVQIKSVQPELPKTLFLRPIPRDMVMNSKDAVIKPIVINKTLNLLQSSAVQMLQKVSTAAHQSITQQPFTTCQNAFNQQTPPVVKKIDNNAAQESKGSSAPRFFNPKEATLPFSWFWQEGSRKKQEFICSKFKWLDENKFEYTKTVIINGDTRTLRYFLRGQEVLSVTPARLSTVNQLIDRLRIYDQISECVGYPKPKLQKNSSSSNLQAEESGETRSKNCFLLGSKKSNSCRKCIEDASRFKENVPRQTSNTSKKSSNTQTTCQAASESPVTHASALMPCEKCGRMITVARMKLHLQIHDGYKPHVCEVCGRGFARKSTLKSHSRFNHLRVPKPFECSTCGHMCTNKRMMENHEMTHTNARPKPFSCSICSKTYQSKANLRKHKRSHTGEKPYACTVCAKSYFHRDSLKKHFRRHHENVGPDGIIDPHIGYTRRKAGSTSEKRHSCTVCGKAYFEKQALFNHVKRSHENGGTPRNRGPRNVVPRFRCEFCQQHFFRVLAYEKHRATHTGDSVGVPCGQPDCDFTYSNLKQLKEHLVARHPEKAFQCELCDKVFLKQSNLTLHQTVHNPAQGFQCI